MKKKKDNDDYYELDEVPKVNESQKQPRKSNDTAEVECYSAGVYNSQKRKYTHYIDNKMQTKVSQQQNSP